MTAGFIFNTRVRERRGLSISRRIIPGIINSLVFLESLLLEYSGEKKRATKNMKCPTTLFLSCCPRAKEEFQTLRLATSLGHKMALDVIFDQGTCQQQVTSEKIHGNAALFHRIALSRSLYLYGYL